jgi:hypothetical protein
VRRPWLIFLFALAAGLLGYGLTRIAVRAPTPALAATPEAQLVWLEREFSLTRAACDEIKRLQLAYEPICEEHCSAIARAQTALKTALAADNATARAAAEAELARLKRVCADSTRAHLQAVAAQMPPAQGARFLALMEPRIAHGPDRTGAPALAPTPASAP